MSKKLLWHFANFGFALNLYFEPRDVWVGVYWDTCWEGPEKTLELYVCIVPLFPLRVSFTIATAFS